LWGEGYRLSYDKTEHKNKTIKCPICNKADKEIESLIDSYISPFNGQKYELYYCLNCSLKWWEPLKMLQNFYEQEGYEGYQSFHMGLNDEIGENQKLFLKTAPAKIGKLLDVGCGDGIDFDRKSIDVAQEKRLLKNTFAMSLEQFVLYSEKNNLKFEVITIFEVLEHQDEPSKFIKTLSHMDI
jgi:2-polyprenyl-3-methyl-5-hydroxy-6-metoxy-1,4-benzoquinol methylase